MGDKPTITDDTNVLDPQVLNTLIEHIGSLASVYHKPPELFVPDFKTIRRRQQAEDAAEDEDDEDMQVSSDSRGSGSRGVPPTQSKAPAASSSGGGGFDIFGDVGAPAAAKPAAASTAGPASLDDLFAPPPGSRPAAGGTAAGGFSFGGPATPQGFPVTEKSVVLPTGFFILFFISIHAASIVLTCTTVADRGSGLEILGSFNRRGGEIYWDVTFTNHRETFMSGFALSVNKNPLSDSFREQFFHQHTHSLFFQMGSHTNSSSDRLCPKSSSRSVDGLFSSICSSCRTKTQQIGRDADRHQGSFIVFADHLHIVLILVVSRTT